MSLTLDTVITRIEAAEITGKRPRVIGRNSHKGTHGRFVYEPAVRIHTDAGIAGWGWSKATKRDAEAFIGANVADLFDLDTGTIQSALIFDIPLWDLAGQLIDKPVYKLLGDQGPDLVPVYDGSIYIDEIDLATGRDEGVGPMLNAVRMGMATGFRAFKVKVGRGFKWMKEHAGMRRDIEVLSAIRDLVGPNITLMIDANNGYTPKQAKQILSETKDCGIYWIEEPFHENIDDLLALKRHIEKQGLSTLIADGEGSEDNLLEFKELVKAGCLDIVQFDFRQYSLTKWKQYMPNFQDTGALAAPHNFGSHLSGFYIPQFARGIGNFATSETDIMAMEGVIASGYQMVDGFMELPASSGFGLDLDEELFQQAMRNTGWSV